MGNTNSQEEVNPNIENQKTKKSKIQRMRTVLRNVLNNKDSERKKKALSDGKNYNNNDMVSFDIALLRVSQGKKSNMCYRENDNQEFAVIEVIIELL